MTTLTPRVVFEVHDDNNIDTDADADDEYDPEAAETESLLSSTSKPLTDDNETSMTGMTHRKLTIRTISTKDLDLGLDPTNPGSLTNTNTHHNAQEDDYYEEVLFDDQLSKSSYNDRRSLFSFQLSLNNTTYTISIPTVASLLQKLQSIDSTPFMRVGWIVLTLYVMTESLRRFDDQTGAFSGSSAKDRVSLNPPAGHPMGPVTSYGTMANANTNIHLPSGMTVSQPQPSSLLNPNIQDGSLSTNQAPIPPIPSSTSTSISSSTYGEHQTPFTTLPTMIEEHLSDVTVPLSSTETPLYWHIPRTGGTMVKTILGTCLGKIMASELGILDGHDQDTKLEMIARERPSGKFLNVDVSTLPGIQRAQSLNLADSGMAQIIATSHFQEMTALFDKSTQHHGRWFGLFRHPVERAISLFFFLSPLQAWGPEHAGMRIDQYVQSPYVESNWMIRYLIGKKAGDIGRKELELAKEIVRRKMVVGIFETMDMSMERFLSYFGWKVVGEDQRQCVNRLLHEQKVGKAQEHESILPGSSVWDQLELINNWDMKLYEYATMLFDEQQSLIRE